jgi:hypothetical protein
MTSQNIQPYGISFHIPSIIHFLDVWVLGGQNLCVWEKIWLLSAIAKLIWPIVILTGQSWQKVWRLPHGDGLNFLSIGVGASESGGKWTQ